jgi:hypothetical protein
MVEADGDGSNIGWTDGCGTVFCVAEILAAGGVTDSLMTGTAGSGDGDVEGHP